MHTYLDRHAVLLCLKMVWSKFYPLRQGVKCQSLEPCNYDHSVLQRDVKHIESSVGTPPRLGNECTDVIHDIVNATISTAFIVAFSPLFLEFHHQRHILPPRFVVLFYPLNLGGNVLCEFAFDGFAVHIGEELVDVLIYLADYAFSAQENLDRLVAKFQAVLLVATVGECVNFVVVAGDLIRPMGVQPPFS